ncbi:MAG: hypothetical protein RE469_05870 [Cuniculiplasma divulgatum]|nr:MAG: hypothetical protein RE469_05870 [Cuniculiplasma divulgatum]
MGKTGICPEEHSGVREIARSQGLIYKAGKDPEHRRSMRECVVPTSLIAQGLADQVVVPMTSLITRGRGKDLWTWWFSG